MGFLRKRSSGQYAYGFRWDGQQYIKALKTDNDREAKQIKKDADEQLARIRNGRSALASKLLADGHSIVDVLFGSEKIAHLINSPTADNPLTLSELRDAFIDHLRNTDRTAGHVDGTQSLQHEDVVNLLRGGSQQVSGTGEIDALRICCRWLATTENSMTTPGPDGNFRPPKDIAKAEVRTGTSLSDVAEEFRGSARVALDRRHLISQEGL